MWALLFALFGAFLLVPGTISDTVPITVSNGKQPHILFLTFFLLTICYTAVISTSVPTSALSQAASSWYNFDLGNDSSVATTSSSTGDQSSLSV